MKKFGKCLSVVVAVALVASINWGYFTQLLALTKNAAMECVTGGSSAGAALTAELQDISVSKFFDFNVDDFITGIWDDFVSGGDSDEDTGATEDVVFDSTTEESVGEKKKITISNERLQHAVLGEFNTQGRMIGGGHGQANIDYLIQNNIGYNIIKVYNNGVRIGNVPSHKTKSKRTGTGQSWFPENWTSEDIKNAGEYVANMPENVSAEDGTWVFGEYNGVRVGIIKNNGEIGTIVPDNSRQP